MIYPHDWERGSVVKNKPVTVSGVAGKSATGARKSLSALVQAMFMKLIGGMGTGVSLEAEDFESGVLHLSKEIESALKAQADEFGNAL